MNAKELERTSSLNRVRPVLAAVLSTALLLGCGESSKDKPASQTAAKVNGEEITVHQINGELARVGVPQGVNTDVLNRRILDGLIDQQLLVQQAVEQKLNRDPQVVQALEQSRRQILAQAYVERLVAGTVPSADEVKEFYAKHPDLFERRRVYAFRDFVFERSQFTEALRTKLNAAKTPADISTALGSQGVKFREGNSSRPAEALPLEALPRIAKLGKGESVAFTDQNLATVLILVDFTEQPVNLQQATPLIQQYLVNAKKRELTQAKVKELKSAAKVEYVGSFAQAAEAKGAESKGAAAKGAETSAPAAPAPAAAAPPAKGEEHMDKGVAGLRR